MFHKRDLTGKPEAGKIFLLLVMFLSGFSAYCQTGTSSKNIVSKLKTFSSSHPTEKAYLQFDKPYYAAGDTIYFKAYVTLGERHELSGLSGVLHVDLINTVNKVDQHIKLQLANGLAWGDFALPDSLPKGNYRVRAYTQWMRNAGDNNYFDQVIPIGSALNSGVPESGNRHVPAVTVKPDLQFFPEGGELVAGVLSKVAFKAIGANGLGADVKGVILDNEGKEVTSFASAHLGMGYFYLFPVAGKSYVARLSYADGSQTKYHLPQVKLAEIVLSVNNDSIPKASVTITANEGFYRENQGTEFTLLVYSGGIVTTVECALDKPVINLDILTRRLRTGIATVTLFSPAGEPISERLIFIQNYNQLNLTVSSDKPVYTKREKVTIKLNAKTRADSAAMGHFSLSVTDESKMPVDEDSESTILTNLLLTSDLKGYVEQPNYYFSRITDTTRANLDLVMLTHGYRRFEWKKLLNNEYPPGTYQPEKALGIAGIAKSLSGEPLVKGSVSLISPQGGMPLSEVTDEKGRFKFGNLVFADSAKFILQAVNAHGKNTTQLSYIDDMEPAVVPARFSQNNDVNQLMAAYIENSRNRFNDYSNAKGTMLKEVKIKGIKDDSHYRTQSLAGAGNADQVIHRSDFHGGGYLSDQLDGRLSGVHFTGQPGGKVAYLNAGAGSPMLIVVDGSIVNSAIDNILLSDVETVEVLKYAGKSMYGVMGAGGVLVITTRQGAGLELQDITSTGLLTITARGFYKARAFYAPGYEHPTESFNRKYLRTTIYWKPELTTDKNGNASFDYYNADGTGNSRVVVEGIDEKGNLGRRVYRYLVE